MNFLPASLQVTKLQITSLFCTVQTSVVYVHVAAWFGALSVAMQLQKGKSLTKLKMNYYICTPLYARDGKEG